METETLTTVELSKSHLQLIIECVEENLTDELENRCFVYN